MYKTREAYYENGQIICKEEMPKIKGKIINNYCRRTEKNIRFQNLREYLKTKLMVWNIKKKWGKNGTNMSNYLLDTNLVIYFIKVSNE